MIPPLSRNSYTFKKTTLQTIEKYNLAKQGDKLVVAVSGGSDSMALLHILASIDLELNLTAVYVDHGLRPQETNGEIKNVASFCDLLDIHFLVREIAVTELQQREDRSTEDAARILRYQALEQVRKSAGASSIAVGHHQDDQVEEFFIRLIRGTGVTGLSGMQPRQNKIIRPLLFQRKTAITSYLRDHNISWSTDSTNLNPYFLRNKVRLSLIPLLKQKFSKGIHHTVLHSMDILLGENDLLETITAEDYRRCVTSKNRENNSHEPVSMSLHFSPFLLLHKAIRRRIIEKVIWEMESRPGYLSIVAVDELASSGLNGQELHLKNGLRVIRENESLYFHRPVLQAGNRGSEKEVPPYEITLNGPGKYRIPNSDHTITLAEIAVDHPEIEQQKNVLIDLDNIEYPLTMRPARPGEKFQPNKNSGRKKISRYFNEVHLDKRKRKSWPIICMGKQVVAIPGYRVDCTYQASKTSCRILMISVSCG